MNSLESIGFVVIHNSFMTFYIDVVGLSMAEVGKVVGMVLKVTEDVAVDAVGKGLNALSLWFILIVECHVGHATHIT